MRGGQAVLILALLVTSACSSPPAPPGPDPALQSLVSEVESKSFDLAYWRTQAGRDNLLWQIAVDFCDEHRHHDLPNCDLVRIARSAEAGAFFPNTSDLGFPEELLPTILFKQPSYGEVSVAPSVLEEPTP